MLRFWVIAWLVGALFLPACSPGHRESVMGSSDQSVQSPDRAVTREMPGYSLGPPGEFRNLTSTPLPEAVDILGKLGSAKQPAALRKLLAWTYHDAGFYAVSRFFKNSSRVVLREPLDYSPIRSPIAWIATDADVTGKADPGADAVGRLILAGKYSQADALASQHLKDGESSLAVVEWASATVRLVDSKPGSFSPGAREAAFRIFITALGEQVNPPTEMLSRAEGFSVLSDAYLKLGDSVSSVTAALEGASLTGDSEKSWEYIAPAVSRRLCTRVRSLALKLHLPKDIWNAPRVRVCNSTS